MVWGQGEGEVAEAGVVGGAGRGGEAEAGGAACVHTGGQGVWAWESQWVRFLSGEGRFSGDESVVVWVGVGALVWW